MAEEPLVMTSVSRTYPGTAGGVHDLSLRLEPGRCFGLLGRNGAGKTTALRLVMGMLRPAAGTVRVFGFDPFADPARAKIRVGYLAEDLEFPGAMTPGDLFRIHETFFPTWDRALEEELAKRLGLRSGSPLKNLSKGEKRQAALICAVAHRPALLVLDEPAGGLDPVVRREFLEAVVDLLSSEGTAVLFSSHILPEVERIADRVGILDRGRLLLEGDLAEVRERACRVLVASPQPVPVESVPGCVRAVARDGATTLTLLRSPEEARVLVRERLGAEPRQVSGISFEDLFVDLVGERP